MKFIPGGPPRYSHQRRGLKKIIRTNGVCALLFDPGTGKTATALDFASILAIKKGVARVLVFAPLAAVDTWVIQAQTYVSPQVHYWAEALGGTIRQRSEALAARGGTPFRATKYRSNRQAKDAAHSHRSIAWASDIQGMTHWDGPGDLPNGKPRLIIEVVNLDALASRQAVGSVTMADVFLNGVKRFEPDLVIVDESHRIKAANGNTSRLLDRIGERVKHRMLLTGTVMPHSPLDIYAQWRFLDPYAFGKNGERAKWQDFKEQFADMGGFMGKEVRGYRDLDVMQDIMSKNSMVVRKEDALDLPPSQEVIVPVHLTPKEQKAYTEMMDDLVTVIDDTSVSVPNKLTQGLRLRQVTSGHVTHDGETLTVGDSKAKVIDSIVNDILSGEDRVVVFAYFKHEIAVLGERLKRKGTTVEVITGDTKSKERIAIRQRFGNREEHPERIVLVAQIKTISLSVNELVTASNAVFGSQSRQRDDWVQGKDRLTRIGQTKPVTFWYANVPGSVDEVILTSHQKRTNLEDAMLTYIKRHQ